MKLLDTHSRSKRSTAASAAPGAAPGYIAEAYCRGMHEQARWKYYWMDHSCMHAGFKRTGHWQLGTAIVSHLQRMSKLRGCEGKEGPSSCGMSSGT
eukprot:scaffold99411_cov17-Tisochrysis_lutea.AAC.1